MRSILTILFSFVVITSASSQKDCSTDAKAYQAGEVLHYDIKYNWGILWVDAGEVVFSVQETTYNKQAAYWFKGYGRSKPKWDWVYTVRDTFDAIGTKQNLSPLYFSRNTSEGSYKVDNVYKYFPQQGYIESTIYNSEKNTTTQKKIDYNQCLWDLLHAVYYARNLNYTNYKINTQIPFNLVIDGKINNLFIRYLGKEVLEMPSEKKYNTLKFSVLLVDGTIFDGGEDMTIWVSDDKNKVALKVEAKIKVGSVKAFLTHTKGLRNGDIKPLAD